MREAIPHRIGVYLAAVQFLFMTTWTVYALFLPQLAASAGIPKQSVVLILLLDQAIFTVADLAMGVAADAASRTVGRVGQVVLAITLVSCAAFLLLPVVAPGHRMLLVVLIAAWAVTSSALRAPPLKLLGKYASQPAQPWLAALSLFGIGVASAVAPYATIALRGVDPRVPFAAASIALALATIGIVQAERYLAARAPAQPAARIPPSRGRPLVGFLFCVVLLGVGFQIHVSINSTALYLRHAAPGDLPYLMPLFWIGFSLFVLPGSLATRRYGGLSVMGAGSVVGGLATYLAVGASSLGTLGAAQLLAGGAWGCVLMSAVAAALVIGHDGHEGRTTGALFASLAVAAGARFALMAGQVHQDPRWTELLSWAPTTTWTFAGIALLMMAARGRSGSEARRGCEG